MKSIHPSKLGYKLSQYAWDYHDAKAQANVKKLCILALNKKGKPYLSRHGHYYYVERKMPQIRASDPVGHDVVVAKPRPARPIRKFNRACKWCKRVAIAVGLFTALILAIYGYIQYAKAMTPAEYLRPTDSSEVKVFKPADLETLLKGEVKEIWDGTKFVPSYDFHLVKEAQAKTEEPTVQDLIVKHFGEDAPMALKIANCESGFNPKVKNKVSTATGVFQILKDTWIGNRKAMGLSTNLNLRLNAEENVKTAKFIFDRRGWQPWSCIDLI